MSDSIQRSPAAAAEEAAKITDCQDLNEVREFIRNQIHGISDSLHELRSYHFDYVAEFILAQFLYSVIPVFILDRWMIQDIQEALASKYNLDPDK